MRALATIMGIIAPATTAFAASGARVDDSGIFVWVFLGFCTLISGCTGCTSSPVDVRNGKRNRVCSERGDGKS